MCFYPRRGEVIVNLDVAKAVWDLGHWKPCGVENDNSSCRMEPGFMCSCQDLDSVPQPSVSDIIVLIFRWFVDMTRAKTYDSSYCAECIWSERVHKILSAFFVFLVLNSFSSDIDIIVAIIHRHSVTVKAGVHPVTCVGKEVNSIYLKCFPNQMWSFQRRLTVFILFFAFDDSVGGLQ